MNFFNPIPKPPGGMSGGGMQMGGQPQPSPMAPQRQGDMRAMPGPGAPQPGQMANDLQGRIGLWNQANEYNRGLANQGRWGGRGIREMEDLLLEMQMRGGNPQSMAQLQMDIDRAYQDAQRAGQQQQLGAMQRQFRSAGGGAIGGGAPSMGPYNQLMLSMMGTNVARPAGGQMGGMSGYPMMMGSYGA